MGTNTQPTQAIIDEFVGVSHGDAARVKEMLAEYIGLATSTASWGETPIQAAAQLAHREIAEMLLAHGAPLDICTASALGMAGKVEEMLKADPGLRSATGAQGIPVMYFPVVGGYQEIAEMLLEHGADVNAGTGGTTSLHGAAMFNRAYMAKWLLSHGADPVLVNYEGKTPLEFAQDSGSGEVAALLT